MPVTLFSQLLTGSTAEWFVRAASSTVQTEAFAKEHLPKIKLFMLKTKKQAQHKWEKVMQK